MIYAGVDISARYDQNNNLIQYTITNTDDDSNLASSTGKVTIKKNDNMVTTEKIYTISGVLERTFQPTGQGTYEIIYAEDNTNKIDRVTITIASVQSNQSKKEICGDDICGLNEDYNSSCPEDCKQQIDIPSLQHPACYGLMIVLIVIIALILYIGFKPKK